MQRQGQESLYEVGDVTLGYFLLAMAYHQTGDCVRTMEYYRTAVRGMDTTRPMDTELMILRSKAETLLGMTNHSAPTRKKEVDAKRRSKP